MRIHLLLVAAFAAAVPFHGSATDPQPAADRPIAIVNARILVTAKGATVEKGVVVVRDGKIEAAGADVKPPRNAEIIDAGGGTVMPGLVNANSRLGFGQGQRGPAMDPGRRGGRRGTPMPGGPAPSAAATKSPRTKALDTLEPGLEIFTQVLKAGVTTIALRPAGEGFPGQGGIVRPAGATVADMTVEESAFLLLGVAANTATKEMLKTTFAAAVKEIERRKSSPASRPAGESRPAAESRPAGAREGAMNPDAARPASGPASRPGPGSESRGTQQPSGPGGQGPQGQQRPDPDLDPIIDAIEGKLRIFVNAENANEVVHFLQVMKEHPAPFVFVSGSSSPAGIHVVADQLGKAKAKAVIPPALSTLPNTQVKVHPALILAAKGVEVSFGIGSSLAEPRRLFFELMELVRAGMSPEAAIAGVTIHPARALGIDRRVGSVEPGKDANLLLFSGDPLEPTSRLLAVWLEGKNVMDARPGPESRPRRPAGD